MQRRPVELYSRFLSAPDQPPSEELNLAWCKITIASQPYQRIGPSQDRFSLKSYMRWTGPDRNVWNAASSTVDERLFLDWGILATNGSSPYETVGVWLSEDLESSARLSYTVQVGFDSGHSPMVFICCTSRVIDELKQDVTAGVGSLFTADWMQLDVDMTQHESKAFSWVDYSNEGSDGVILSFYSRKGFRINWKAVALHLEPVLEDETGLEWSLGIQNTLVEDSDKALRSAVGQIEVESILRPQRLGLMDSFRLFFIK